jgi:tetratricopeptide (TPR) repeat protein
MQETPNPEQAGADNPVESAARPRTRKPAWPLSVKQKLVVAAALLLMGGLWYLQSDEVVISPVAEQRWQESNYNGQLFMDAGEYKEAQASFDRALKLAERLKQDDLTRESLCELADLYAIQSQDSRRDEILPRLRELHNKLLAEKQQTWQPLLQEAQNCIASPQCSETDAAALAARLNALLSAENDASSIDAGPLIEPLLKVSEKMPDSNREKGTSYLNAAEQYRLEGKYQQAEKTAATAAVLRKQTDGEFSNEHAAALKLYGLSWLGLGNYEKGDGYLRKAQVIYGKNFGDNVSKESGEISLVRAIVNAQVNNQIQAKDAAAHAIHSLSRTDENDKHYAANMIDLAQCYAMQGMRKKAELAAGSALEVYERAKTKQYFPLSKALSVQSKIISKGGDEHRAEAMAKRSQAIRKRLSETL